MKNINFNEMLFVIEVIKIAQKKGFKFNSKDGVLKVEYPLYNSDKQFEVSNFKEIVYLCDDIIKWK